MDGSSPNLFFYSLWLPAVWLSLTLPLLVLAPDFELGILGIVIATNLSLFISCRQFTKSFKRQFTTKEKAYLAAYSLLCMAMIRALNIYGLSDQLKPMVMIYVSLIVLAIDVLVISSSIFSLSNKFNAFWQKRMGVANA